MLLFTRMVCDSLVLALFVFLGSTLRAQEIPIGPMPYASILFCIIATEATCGYIRGHAGPEGMLGQGISPTVLQSMLKPPVSNGDNCQLPASSAKKMLR